MKKSPEYYKQGCESDCKFAETRTELGNASDEVGKITERINDEIF